MDQQSMGSFGPGGTGRVKNFDEKFCESCGEIIKIKAEICPKCGVRQRGHINKAALLLFTFFLGGLGAHKFYTGKNLLGVLYLLFCWTGIPAFIALIEFIIYAFTSSERLQEKYQSGGNAVVIACVAAGIGIIYFAGVFAAIAIPMFVKSRNQAYQAVLSAELQNLRMAEDEYFIRNDKFSSNLRELNFRPENPDVEIEILQADKSCFEARGVHAKIQKYTYVDCKGVKRPDW